MAILIDGFNLIYKFPDLEGLMYQGKLSDARKGLLNKLKEYSKITGARIRVVFDGKKEPSLEIKTENVGTIDVYYSLEYSADHLIKEFIKKDPNPRMSTVVTSDKDITYFVQRFRVKIKRSEEFADHLNKTIEKWMESRLPEKEENPVLTEEDIVFWENFFNNNGEK
jgi:predicted RNA-binding protein with PIN domain